MTKEQLSLVLLEEVILQWRQHLTDVEIGSDVQKIAILNAARDVLHDCGIPIPPEVADLYNKVYLRDVWTCSKVRHARRKRNKISG